MKWMMLASTLAMLNLAGCDASKDELDQTKATLTSVTKDRDDLKSKLNTMQAQLDAAKAELAKAQATAATIKPADAKPDAKADAKTAAKTTDAKSKTKHKS